MLSGVDVFGAVVAVGAVRGSIPRDGFAGTCTSVKNFIELVISGTYASGAGCNSLHHYCGMALPQSFLHR